jgi:hypothetical protein
LKAEQMTAIGEGRRARSSACDKVSNGRLLPKSVDLRTASGRRFRHLVQSLTEELGGNLGEVDQNLVRQAASLTLAAERLSSDIVNGAAFDSDALVRINSELRRVLAALRAKAAKNKPAGPTLADFIARKAAEKAASASDGEVA